MKLINMVRVMLKDHHLGDLPKTFKSCIPLNAPFGSLLILLSCSRNAWIFLGRFSGTCVSKLYDRWRILSLSMLRKAFGWIFDIWLLSRNRACKYRRRKNKGTMSMTVDIDKLYFCIDHNSLLKMTFYSLHTFLWLANLNIGFVWCI